MKLWNLLLVAVAIAVAAPVMARADDGGNLAAETASHSPKPKAPKVAKKSATQKNKPKSKKAGSKSKKGAKGKKASKGKGKKAGKGKKSKKGHRSSGSAGGSHKSHAPKEAAPKYEPVPSTQISPEQKDDLPAPNTGSLSE